MFLANDVLILPPCTTAIFFCVSVSCLSKYSERKAGTRNWELVRWWRNLQKIKFLFHLIFYPVWRMAVLHSKTIFGSQIALYFVEFCSKRILTASISCKMTAVKFVFASIVGIKIQWDFCGFLFSFYLRWIAIQANFISGCPLETVVQFFISFLRSFVGFLFSHQQK